MESIQSREEDGKQQVGERSALGFGASEHGEDQEK